MFNFITFLSFPSLFSLVIKLTIFTFSSSFICFDFFPDGVGFFFDGTATTFFYLFLVSSFFSMLSFFFIFLFITLLLVEMVLFLVTKFFFLTLFLYESVAFYFFPDSGGFFFLEPAETPSLKFLIKLLLSSTSTSTTSLSPDSLSEESWPWPGEQFHSYCDYVWQGYLMFYFYIQLLFLFPW